MKKSLVLIILVFAFLSCKKDRACLKSNGDEVSKEVAIDNNIDSLFLNDDLYYTLVPSNEAKVVLTGGENMLNLIDIVSENGKLYVNNGNKCRFLRSYKHKIYVEIHVDNITYIEYKGSRELKSKDKLYSNELRLFIKDGAGEVDLEIENGYTSTILSSGFGNFFLRGKTAQCYLHCNSNGYGDARKLEVSEKIKVYSNTAGDILINADNADLSVEILQNGNVGYVGTPLTKTVKKNGKGKLINLN